MLAKGMDKRPASSVLKWIGCICTVFSISAHAAEPADKDAAPERDFTGFYSPEQAQPLWEFGLAGGLTEGPDYPSSAERNFFAIALPYAVYRGDIFRVGDGQGARAVMFDMQDLEIGLSFGGALPADSEDNTLREGMPDLDLLFEIGPQLIYRIEDFSFASGGSGRLNFRLQTRAAFSTDFNRLDHRGFVVEPRLSYQQRGRLHPETALNLSVSAIFATERLHDYFYAVDAEFANAQRAQFDASGGYIGTELSVGFSFPVTENIRAFLDADVLLHQGARNQNSPLFEDDVTYSFSAGFVWRLYKSKQRANW